jgi:NAD(P)-dependent dehydrogenase (short-subunit alcohol dehydrogenase family)
MSLEISAEELEICLKVLQQVADKPSMVDTHDRFKSLISKIYRTSRKDRRKTNKQQRRDEDRSLTETATIVRSQTLDAPDAITLPSIDSQLHQSRTCYICKQPYRQIDRFYHQLCPDCAAFNFSKREQRSDLTGRTALVTGGRIKIGYQTGLRLLQDGARVIVTTRFPADAARRFSQEPDFDRWAARLQIHGLDLRNLPALELFIQDLLARETALDIIINNAAQTIKRPAAFYRSLLQAPALSPALSKLLADDRQAVAIEHVASSLSIVDPDFPLHRIDGEGEPIDLRPTNSWKHKLDEVETVELLEVQLVNAIAPFMLNCKLKPLMLKSPHQRRFIINVSAMEGQFNRASKTIYHPHTNMAKAALNMMTRTSAADYASDGIYMNGVDTGWITNENPYAQREYQRDRHGFYPPLDIIDGMSRIYDPIAQGINQPAEPIYGCFLKDYRSCEW